MDDRAQPELAALWGSVGGWIDDPTTKKLGVRGNFRLNVKAALAAIAQTAGIIAKLGVATTVTPMALLGLGTAAASAIASCLSAVRESMRESEFLMCVVLSHARNGTTEDELRQDVRMFLKHDPRIFPWYLGIDADLFAKSAELNDDQDFRDVLRTLEKDGYARGDGERLHYVERNVSLKVF